MNLRRLRIRKPSANRRVQPVVAASAVLAVILSFTAFAMTLYATDLSAQQVVSAASLNPLQPRVKQAPKQVLTDSTSRRQSCVPVASSLPTPLSLTDSAPGFKQQIDSPATYQIYGNDAAAWRTQIRSCAPKSTSQTTAEFTAETKYQLTWRYQTVENEGQCHISNASVGIHVSQVLPIWQPTTATPTTLITQWNAFVIALSAHENGHTALDIEYAQRLLNDLNNYPATPCDQFAQSVKQLTDTDVSELEQANDNYDSNTDHGATQGAILP